MAKEVPNATRQPMYANILNHVIESNEKVAKVDSTKLGVKVQTLYYGLRNQLKKSVKDKEYKLYIRTSDKQVWIERL